MDRGLMARRVGVRFGRWIDAHALHKFFESSLFAVCAAAFGGFDGIEELAAFAAAVFDKRLHVLLKALHGLFHLGIELACSLKAGVEIDVCLVDFAVSAQDCVSLAGERFVFVLF
jgi:hypothetical protein